MTNNEVADVERPGFGVEPGANDEPLRIEVSDTARKGLYAYLESLNIASQAAARRPSAAGVPVLQRRSTLHPHTSIRNR